MRDVTFLHRHGVVTHSAVIVARRELGVAEVDVCNSIFLIQGELELKCFYGTVIVVIVHIGKSQTAPQGGVHRELLGKTAEEIRDQLLVGKQEGKEVHRHHTEVVGREVVKLDGAHGVLHGLVEVAVNQILLRQKEMRLREALVHRQGLVQGTDGIDGLVEGVANQDLFHEQLRKGLEIALHILQLLLSLGKIHHQRVVLGVQQMEIGIAGVGFDGRLDGRLRILHLTHIQQVVDDIFVVVAVHKSRAPFVHVAHKLLRKFFYFIIFSIVVHTHIRSFNKGRKSTKKCSRFICAASI